MQIVSAIVSACNLLLSLVIGLRLVRLGRSRAAKPEFLLGLYFLLAPFLGMGLSSVVYLSWADPDLALAEPMSSIMHAAYIFGVSAGMACLHVFTLLTFRRNERGARWLVTLLLGGLAASFVVTGLSGGFELRVVPNAAYWTGSLLRTSVYPWLLFESFRYWSLARRRLRLGLVDPLLCNRFLLWGCYGCAMLLMGLIDPLARIWYVAIAGDSVTWNPELGRPIIHALVAVTSGLGIAVMVTVYLTFFPTLAYRRWVEGRAAKRA